MQETWLITGGAGFIGSAAAKKLVSENQKVIVYDNFSSSDGSLLKPIKNKIKIIKADITNAKKLQKACTGVDYILHHAALVSVPISLQEPDLTHEINIGGTLNVLEAALKNQVRRVIFASSSAVYGNGKKSPYNEFSPTDACSPYAASKLIGEEMCTMFYKAFGLETVVLRYFNVYGPDQNQNSPYSAVIAKFISAVKTSGTLNIDWDGKQSRDFVFIDDVVNANFLAIKKAKAGEVYNVSSGKSHTLLQLAKLIESICGKKMSKTFSPKREGDIRKSAADITKITSLGFKPGFTLEQGLRGMLNPVTKK